MTEKHPKQSSVLARVLALEQQQEELQEEIRNLREQISGSLWAAESIATVLLLIGGPLKKAIEIVITGLILYVLAHIRMAP